MAFASCLDAIVEMLQMHARLKCCTGVGSIRHARFRAPSCHISPPPRCHKQTTSCRPSCTCSARTPCQGPLPSSSRRGFPPTRCREAELPIISPDLLWSHCRMIRLARRAACSPGPAHPTPCAWTCARFSASAPSGFEPSSARFTDRRSVRLPWGYMSRHPLVRDHTLARLLSQPAERHAAVCQSILWR